MTSVRSAGRAGALLIPLALIVTACSGASGSASPAGSAAAPAGAATPTPAGVIATATPSSGATPSQPAIAIPSFDISGLTAGLANVDSYRVSIIMKGVEEYKGVVVTKPVLSRDLTIGGNTRIVVIGNEAWVGEGDGALKAVPGTLATQMFAAYDPTLLVAAFSGAGWAQSAQNKGTEQKNGVNTTHYRIDGTSLAAGFSGLPAGATIDTWISDKGFLVALETTGFPSGDMSIQVTGVDDPANKVERPS